MGVLFKASVIGYYGFQNFGDDMFLYFLTENILPILSSKYSFVIPIGGSGILPREISSCKRSITLRRLNYVSLYDRIFSKVYMISLMVQSRLIIRGGGTFLYEQNGIKNLKSNLFLFETAKKFRKSTIIGLGIGIDPFIDLDMRKIACKIIDNFDFIVFRDSSSQFNAANIIGSSIYEKSMVLPDLAYGLTSKFRQIRDQCDDISLSTKISPKIGINLLFPIDSTLEKKDIELIKNFINRLIKENIDVYFIICQNYKSSELQLLKEVLPYFPTTKVIYYTSNIFGFLNEISKLDILICSKFHLCIAAHILEKPFFVLEYQKKVRYLMEEIHFSDGIFSYKDLDLVYSRVISRDFSFPRISAHELEGKLMEGLCRVIKQM